MVSILISPQNEIPKEVYYNPNYPQELEGKYECLVGMDPVIYKHPDYPAFKKLILNWKALMKTPSGIDILRLKLQIEFDIDPEERNQQSMVDIKALILSTCNYMSEFYKTISIDHTIKFIDIYKNYSQLDQHANFIHFYLYPKRSFLKILISSVMANKRSIAATFRMIYKRHSKTRCVQ